MNGAAATRRPAASAAQAAREATLAEVRAAVEADTVWCPDPDLRVAGVVAADLMSDVLVDARPGFVLVTGLTSVQAIRTAAIADLAAVVFARGKAVPPEVAALAREMNVPVFTSPRSLFDAAGALYEALGHAAPAPGQGPEG